ncbi:hypothetical protein BJY14_002674 [Actinomadura luteofluorescens]|uniref:Uncharacterized protein n=1 Tax=Actinomadura luteofluorescens TaxID=46163 RepID=A0A7Y9EF86_9ACTN|nr:hypothetical protein [Actinomadura luteofluorescens]NYD46691.1 hypothetical protein [Actinomadura luteofluorescens]
MPEQSPTRFTMVPARRSSEPTARRRARRILIALFLAAALSIVAVFVALTSGSSKPDLSAVTPQGRDLSYTAAMNFLAGRVQDVPRADSFDPQAASVEAPDGTSAPLDYRALNWVGFTPRHFGTKELGFTDFEIHHYLVVLNDQAATQSPSPAAGGRPSATPSGGASATPSGGASAPPSGGAAASPSGAAPQAGTTGTPSPSTTAGPQGSPSPGASETPPMSAHVLQLDVPVLLDPSGPRLAASPAFSVWKNGTGKPKGTGDYTNYRQLTTEVSTESKNQILRWAAAYATGDSTALLAVTGDQDPKHRYEGLSGFRLADSSQAVQILSAIKTLDDQLVVRVRIMLARAEQSGTVPGKKGNVKPFTNFADFDLLVGASGAQPPVLAWGPAGSAAELNPYSNALNN